MSGPCTDELFGAVPPAAGHGPQRRRRGQFAVGHPVRPGASAPSRSTLLASYASKLPRTRTIVLFHIAFPGQDVGAGAIEEPAVGEITTAQPGTSPARSPAIRGSRRRGRWSVSRAGSGLPPSLRVRARRAGCVHHRRAPRNASADQALKPKAPHRRARASRSWPTSM